jgi:O-antigen chain-terminating methyltransferase
MFTRTVSTDDLARLKREREDADREYNAALTALDRALLRLRDVPHPPPPYDEHQLRPLNEQWNLLAVRPIGTGWRGRFWSAIWSAVSPLFERQHAFNAALVEHLNRNTSVHREVATSAATTLTFMHEELIKTIEFQSRIVQHLQTITPYVDTKDREIAGIMRRINEDVGESLMGSAGALGDVADELRKRSESMTARERRYEAQIEDVRASFAVVNQVTQTLKRELERLQQAAPPAITPGSDTKTPAKVAGSSLGSHKYVGFEDLYRGSREDIRNHLASYLEEFVGATDVVDIGCGRGEFLELLRDRGIAARGIDSNHEMVEVCKERGLVCDETDALGFLRAQPDESVGGLFAAQVVEHLEPSYLLTLLDTAYLKLRPGAKLILETINAASWSAFFFSYIRDITHVRALHPETLEYFVRASGFQNVHIRYLSPHPDDFKLKPIPVSSQSLDGTPSSIALAMTLNRNVEKLNDLLFADQDYAVIAERR